VFITYSNWLMLFKEITSVHAENRYFVGKIRSNCLLNKIINLVATGF
jgi:hypothetical protein